MIMAGFGLSAASTLILFFVDMNSIGYPNSFQSILDPLLPTCSIIAELCAFALLTRFEARDEGQLKILRLVYLFFAAQYLFIVIGYNYLFTPIHSFGSLWNTAGLWIRFVGVVVTACGLFLMSRSLVTITEDERPKVNQP